MSTASQHKLLNSNIKVVARFRPKLRFEEELEDSPSQLSFTDPKSLSLLGPLSTEVFTLDRIFESSSTQREVYDFIGRPTINDVMIGYNGTIFAYGQTGSGKTHTMMGNDIYSEELKGVVPRAVSQIFEHLMSDMTDTEYTVKCSILEIYKENLRDLLNLGGGLTIKQDVYRGIYVKGLTVVSVSNEFELLELISLGDRLRTVAATKMNQQSSRSHLLFILEVRQKLPNDSEKVGKLNLVDLAGSEKVRKSGVTGNKLEEAKKINLSLSALGNVIHALTVKSEHAPFRDSKLTRLLQESLGGNFKTTLSVCCSPSSASVEETLSSLKFATRAKTIKNKVTMNIKNSREGLLKQITELKVLLQAAHRERDLTMTKSSSSRGSSPESKKRRMSNAQTCCDLASKVEKLKQQKRNLTCERDKYSERTETLEQALGKHKRKLFEVERKCGEYYELYHKTLLLINKDASNNSLLHHQNKSLSKQLTKLSSSLEDLNVKYKDSLSTHMKQQDSTFIEFDQGGIEVLYERSTPVLTEVDEFPDEFSIQHWFDRHTVNLSPETVLQSSDYAKSIQGSLELNTNLSKDIAIFELRNSLVHSACVNASLIRKLFTLDWKLHLINEKFKLKQKLCRHQQQQVLELERMVDHLHDAHGHLVKLCEQSEGDSKLFPCKITKLISARSFAGKNGPKETASFLKITDESYELAPSVSAKLKGLETSLSLQQIYNAQLKTAADTYKGEGATYKELLSKFEKDVLNSQKIERERWSKIFSDLTENYKRELTRKQEEIVRFNEMLAEWIQKFVELQELLEKRERPLPFTYYKQLDLLIQQNLTQLRSSATRPQPVFLIPNTMNQLCSPGPVPSGDTTPLEF